MVNLPLLKQSRHFHILVSKLLKMQYDQIGEEYTRQQKEFFGEKLDFPRRKIRKYLKDISGEKVLDIGCGGGDDVLWCEEQGAEAYGIDPSEKMVKLAISKVKNKERIKSGSYTKIPFPNNYFDFAFGRFSLHYVPKLDEAYNEMARVLKPNGTLLQVVSHPTFDSFMLQNSEDKSLISVKLFNGKVTVKFPPHNLKDYFSKTFLRWFDLKEVDETESDDAENPNKFPETLFIMALKR